MVVVRLRSHQLGLRAYKIRINQMISAYYCQSLEMGTAEHFINQVETHYQVNDRREKKKINDIIEQHNT